MADEMILESLSDMDPYDREERCRKTIRTLMKAIVMRVAAGVLLAVAVIRANAAPIALCLTGFALLLILSGLIPLAREWKKQRILLKECIAQQEEAEKKNQKESPAAERPFCGRSLLRKCFCQQAVKL